MQNWPEVHRTRHTRRGHQWAGSAQEAGPARTRAQHPVGVACSHHNLHVRPAPARTAGGSTGQGRCGQLTLLCKLPLLAGGVSPLVRLLARHLLDQVLAHNGPALGHGQQVLICAGRRGRGGMAAFGMRVMLGRETADRGCKGADRRRICAWSATAALASSVGTAKPAAAGRTRDRGVCADGAVEAAGHAQAAGDGAGVHARNAHHLQRAQQSAGA